MTEQDTRPVVVGVDGSAHALRAARIAARHAAARDVELRIVYAGDSARTTVLPRQVQIDPQVFGLLADAETEARIEEPGLKVHRHAVPGSPEIVLLGQSRDSSLLVIGEGGHGARFGRLFGSLGAQLVGRTCCPLLVVHHLGDRGGPVVVGADDRPASEEVIREAFRQARLFGCPLRVIHAWHVPLTAMVGPAAGLAYRALDRVRVDAVVEQAERIGSEFPGVPMTTQCHNGREHSLLAAAAEGASLLVLGAEAAHGLHGLLHGSPALAAAQHAACPVLVVPTNHDA